MFMPNRKHQSGEFLKIENKQTKTIQNNIILMYKTGMKLLIF